MNPVRTRTMAAMGGAILFALLGLLVAGAMPRIRANRPLSAAAETVRTAVPGVYVIQPQRTAAADLSLAATTHASPDATIYARTSGSLRRRLVDIGDRLRHGQPH